MKHLPLAIALAALGYLVFAHLSGGAEVGAALTRVGLGGLLAALGLSLVNYGLRFLRWQAYLHALEHPLPWAASLRIYLAGFALTTTPGKAGEALRSLLLKPLGVSYPASLGAFFSERLSDLAAIVLLALVGLTLYPPARPVVAVGAALLLVALALVAQGRWLGTLLARALGNNRLGELAGHAGEALEAARRCHRPMLLTAATALSLLAWAAEAWAFHLILDWMGLSVSLQFATFVYSVAVLAGALSFLPGGLGATEAVMAALLIWRGVPAAEAAAATVLIRVTTLWFAVGLGALAVGTPPRHQEPSGP